MVSSNQVNPKLNRLSLANSLNFIDVDRVGCRSVSVMVHEFVANFRIKRTDIVIWDSHPLALGATPEQVWIDGIAQINPSFSSQKPALYQKLPQVPDHSAEASEALEYEGLPPLLPKEHDNSFVLFVNVQNVFAVAEDKVYSKFTATGDELGVVLVIDGSIACTGSHVSCMTSDATPDVRIVDLKGKDSQS